jgi:molybdopterin-guanine dinucleotide biosynthesis protein A
MPSFMSVMAPQSKWGVAILAGGQGVRMGGRKPECIDAGQRLIDRALGQAQRWAPNICLSLRTPDQIPDLPGDITVVLDPPGDIGPAAGLIAALTWAQSQNLAGLLTIPCDMPDLHYGIWERLLTEVEIASISGNTALCFMPVDTSGFCPILTLWRTEALPSIRETVAGGRHALKHLISDLGGRWVAVPDGWLGRNINTPDDLRSSLDGFTSKCDMGSVDHRVSPKRSLPP